MHETPEIRALREIAETPIGRGLVEARDAAQRMGAIAIAALESAGVLASSSAEPLVRLGQGEFTTDYTPHLRSEGQDARLRGWWCSLTPFRPHRREWQA